jgi:hypothetical protein
MNNPQMYDYIENKSIKKYVTVGQTVYAIPQNNIARAVDGSKYNNILELKVTRVGNKYFYLDGILERSDYKFGADCGYIRDISNYCSCYHIYLTKNDLDTQIFLDTVVHMKNREFKNSLIEMINKVIR